MHTRSIIQVFSFAVIVTVGVVWLKSRATAIDLQARLSALTTVRRHTARALEQERDRLRSALMEANQHRQAGATAASSALVVQEPSRAVALAWALGEWRSSWEWRNEGQSSARSTVATLLWAAAGGDLATMMSTIAFDEPARTRAQTLFDALPPNARQAFPTPEALVAGLTIQAVPNSAGQLSWFHQRDADHATVGVFLSAPDQTAPMAVSVVPAQDNNPPMLTDPHANKLTVLSLQRSSLGWRVVITAAAVERLARGAKVPAN